MKNILEAMRTIYKYRISFKRSVPIDFLKKMKENKSIIKLISRERHIECSVYEESVFLKIRTMSCGQLHGIGAPGMDFI